MTRKPGYGPTLEEVAALAGVGRGTASRVINGSSQVSERTRRAVEAAVAELGYIPNAAARALKTRRTDAIALVIAESEDRIFGEPFFAGVVRGISAEVSAVGKQLVLLLSQVGDRSARLENYLSPQHVDGVLLLSLHDDDRLPDVIRSRSLPMVLGGRTGSGAAAPWVDVDNERGAGLAAELLVETGCRVIGTITGPLDMTAGRDRYDGFRAALADLGRELDDDLVAHGDFSGLSGARAMAELLERRPDIDGVFCANDPMAAAALQVLRDAGRRVPDDVSVVGFDDSPLAVTTHPPLTTVSQSPEEMGRTMVALLLEEIARAEPVEGAEATSRVLATSVVERGSTRPRP
jgi:DNA-binding LacI/PurR family transcriptional regulator